jgi:tetratricopeptide (TPR) repeat protein
MKFIAVLAWFIAAVATGSAEDFTDVAAQAAAARQGNNVPNAIALYRKAVQLNAQWQEGWWFLGTMLYDTDRYADAENAFDHFVALNGRAAPGWAFLGLCEYETGASAKALEHINRGLSLGIDADPQLKLVLLYHEALLLTRFGKFDQALQKYGAIIRGADASKLNESLLASIGLAALRASLLPKELPPAQTDLHVKAGTAATFVLLGDYVRAESAFSDLLKQYGNAPNVHYMRGVYLLARDPDAAFAEFKRELQISPSNPAANQMLALGLLTRGDPDLALPYAKKALESMPNDPFDTYLMGRALVETGKLERGVQLLESAEKVDATNTDVHVTLAAAYSQLGRPKQARDERELVLRMENERRPVAQQ